jgi:hypothetical protein
MSQRLFLVMLLLLSGAAVKAATVSGIVVNAATCAPVAGQMVYARDSFHTWQDSAVTNSAGIYSIVIPPSAFSRSVDILFLSTSACGSTITRSTFYEAGVNSTCNFGICGNDSYIFGYIGPWVPGGLHARIWLIRRDITPVTLDTVLTAIDSTFTPTNSNGGYFFTRTCPSPSATYLLKAALLPSDPRYSSYMPSYMDSALTWSGALSITGAAFTASGLPNPIDYNIYLKAGSNPGGPGFIGGSVLLGANKSTAVGDPLSSRILLLTTASGQAVGYTYSDPSGKFKFSNLPLGTYKLFGDAGGKANPALTVTLSNATQSISDIVFEENSKKFEGHSSSLNVGAAGTLADVSIFPNPATDVVNITGLGAIKGNKAVILSSLTGYEISRQVVAGDAAHIAAAALPAGIYILQVQTEAGNAAYRFVRQ